MGARWLNSRGFTLRGARFNNSNLAAMLSLTNYIGYYFDAKQNEFKEPLPEDHWIKVACPALVSEEEYLAVAALRAMRSPKKTPPRVITGVTMLPASIARCGHAGCDAGLTVRTGKSGQYHYYCCSARVNQGADACDLPSIRREELDRIVIEEIASRVFSRGRLVVLLRHLLDRSEEVNERRRKDLAVAKAEVTNASKAITNLLLTIESGAMRPDDPLFVERMAHNRARKAALEADVESLERQLATSKVRISEDMIQAFAEKMARALLDESDQFRKDYVRLFVSRVELSAQEIRIKGTKSALERALVRDAGPPDGMVPIFDREWCPEEDSNLHGVAPPPPEDGASTNSAIWAPEWLGAYPFSHR